MKDIEDLSQQFYENGFVYIPELVDAKWCGYLAQTFKQDLDNGLHSAKDHQCPTSEAVYAYPHFDKLLADLWPYMEKFSSQQLLPAYTYARWYIPGEELKIHRDRPSCEISATVTLAYEGEKWPIFMGALEDKSDGHAIAMKVGDAVLYRGNDLYHWRNPYVEGKWQLQVFLHYVRANGKYADHKYDKRPQLASPPELTGWRKWLHSLRYPHIVTSRYAALSQ
jgi:hypothetical protein